MYWLGPKWHGADGDFMLALQETPRAQYAVMVLFDFDHGEHHHPDGV